MVGDPYLATVLYATEREAVTRRIKSLSPGGVEDHLIHPGQAFGFKKHVLRAA